MRMETRRALELALWRERMKWVGGGLLVVAALGAIMWFTGLDAAVETHPVAGVIERVGPVSGTSTIALETALAVDVKLDDGRMAHVTVKRERNPAVGDKVEIKEHVHGTGRTTYSWQ